MPTIKRFGPPQKQCGKLLEKQDFYLLFGVYLDGTQKFESKDLEQRMWRKYRKDLIQRFSKERPGQLPWAWWRWDYPKANRESPYDVLGVAGQDRYGFEVREIQWQHLKRMGLLKKVTGLGYIEPPKNGGALQIQQAALKDGKRYRRVQ